MVGPAGIEPATLGLEIRCSIRLSYGPTITTESEFSIAKTRSPASYKQAHGEEDTFQSCIQARRLARHAGDSEGMEADIRLFGRAYFGGATLGSDGMPLRREGRYVETTMSELNDWLSKQSGKPVHVVTDETDLSAELKRGLSYVRHKH
jgi:hypothetical protein